MPKMNVIKFKEYTIGDSYDEYKKEKEIWEKEQLTELMKVGKILTYTKYHCPRERDEYYIITKVTEKTITMKPLEIKRVSDIDKTYGNYLAVLVNTSEKPPIRKNKNSISLWRFLNDKDELYDFETSIPRSVCIWD